MADPMMATSMLASGAGFLQGAFPGGYAQMFLMTHLAGIGLIYAKTLMEYVQLFMSYLFALCVVKIKERLRYTLATTMQSSTRSRLRSSMSGKEELFTALHAAVYDTTHDCECSAGAMTEHAQPVQTVQPLAQSTSLFWRFFVRCSAYFQDALEFFELANADEYDAYPAPGAAHKGTKDGAPGGAPLDLKHMLRLRKTRMEKLYAPTPSGLPYTSNMTLGYEDIQPIRTEITDTPYAVAGEPPTVKYFKWHADSLDADLFICTRYTRPYTYAKSGAETDKKDEPEDETKNASITVTVTSLGQRPLSEDEINAALVDFLLDGIHLMEHVVFIYRVDFQSRNWRDRIKTYFETEHSATWNSSSMFLSDFGDGKCPFVQGPEQQQVSDRCPAENAPIGQHVQVLMTRNVDTPMDTYEPLITLVNKGKTRSTKRARGLEHSYAFYAQHYLFHSPLKVSHTGSCYKTMYYDKDLVIILMFHMNTGDPEIHMYALSPGRQVTRKEIVYQVNMLMTTAVRFGNGLDLSASRKAMSISKYVPNEGWSSSCLRVREFDTIYLDPGVKREICTEIEDFLHFKKFYEDVQVPYKKGILLYGPPGTGKTSLVTALAYHYQMDIYSLDVNMPGVNDQTIVTIMNRLSGSKPKILLFEDIDTAFADKEKLAQEMRETRTTDPVEKKACGEQGHGKEAKKKSASDSGRGTMSSEAPTRRHGDVAFLTYSGLLNALDGVWSNQIGVITIMTTNYIERLGPAILRPGRMDAKIYLGACTRPQLVAMTTTLVERRLAMIGAGMSVTLDEALPVLVERFADALCDADGNTNIKPCELQNYIMHRIRNVASIFEDVALLRALGDQAAA